MSFLTSSLFWEVCGVIAVTAAACSVLGAFLVLRRLALLTDAIGHVLLLGIIVAFFLTHDLRSPLLMLGAALAGLATVALVELASKSRLVKEDAAIGLVFPALFALGVILATLYTRNVHLDVDRVLLGSPELAPLNRLTWTTAAVSSNLPAQYDLGPMSLYLMGGMLALNCAFVALFFKELKLSTFDAGLAFALGFAPAILHYALMGLVSLTAVTAFDAVGPVLVVAFFVVPPAAAYLLTDRLAPMLLLSVALGIGGAVGGTILAYALGVTISGTVAVFMGGIFAVVLALAPRHGLVANARRRWRQRQQFFDTMLAIHLLQHEGTAAEPFESRLATLHEHMNWTREHTAKVARAADARGWVTRSGEFLHLTPDGRQAAQNAFGRPNQSTTESVS